MNKNDLIKVVVNETKMKKKEAKALVELIFDNITDALINGQQVRVSGFGNFEVRERNERKGRNPQTGENLLIPASKAPAFKPSRPLKRAVNE